MSLYRPVKFVGQKKNAITVVLKKSKKDLHNLDYHDDLILKLKLFKCLPYRFVKYCQMKILVTMAKMK